MSQFKNSIAQDNVNYPIETVITPIAGENYSRALIYMNVAEAGTNLPGVTEPAAGDFLELDSSNYGEITGGKLKTWLAPFFAKAITSKVGIALYDEDQEGEEPTPATAPLSTVYEATKMYAYFKFGLAGTTEAYNELQVDLSNLCLADPLYSTLWIGTSDSAVLTSTSTLISLLNASNSKARVVYNADSNINGALAQLGATLSEVNSTGTPVGNSMDMVQFNTIGASGAAGEDGTQNLTTTQKTALDGQKIGYQTFVGDGTENVVTEGSLNLKGESVGANWLMAYVEYSAKVKTADYITRMNKFRNNQTYQGIITILQTIVKPFIDMGRLDRFQITAPLFKDLPTSGDEITVPNAWQADYIDNVRKTTVYGTLYITQAIK